MSDMTQTILPKSDQLNSDDLIVGPITVTITKVTVGAKGSDQPVVISYDGDGGKPWKPCLSMRRVLVFVWKKDSAAYVGKSLTLYRDPAVRFGGEPVGGIRISHMSGIDKPLTMALTETKKIRKAFTVHPLAVAPAVDKAAEGVRALVQRIEAADHAALEAITSDPAVTKQREWLEKNRPDLAARVTLAITDAIAAIDAASTAAGADALPTDPP